MSTSLTRTHATEWVCVDCHLTIAGYGPDETGRDMPTPFADFPDVEDVTNGTAIGECGTPECVASVEAHTLSAAPDDSDYWIEALDMHDECDHDSFSLHPCAGCGSTLAGDRYAVTVTYVEWEG